MGLNKKLNFKMNSRSSNTINHIFEELQCNHLDDGRIFIRSNKSAFVIDHVTNIEYLTIGGDALTDISPPLYKVRAIARRYDSCDISSEDDLQSESEFKEYEFLVTSAGVVGYVIIEDCYKSSKIYFEVGIYLGQFLIKNTISGDMYTISHDGEIGNFYGISKRTGGESVI